MSNKYTHVSLFSGIGGFDLAAERTGKIKTLCFVEKNEFCAKVLNKNFPNTPIFNDIKNFNGHDFKNATFLSGGFPCQPFSVAGKRRGAEDDRFLWKEMYRVIREVKPLFVICENVPGIIGMELDTVINDLENEEYKTETFVLPAYSIGAPHKRDRVWVIAYSGKFNGWLLQRQSTVNGSIKEKINEYCNICTPITNPNSIGESLSPKWKQPTVELFGCIGSKGITSNTDSTSTDNKICAGGKFFTVNNWKEWTTESGVCGVDDGISDRVDRIKALGNAIVPQIAELIFNVIISEIEQ